MADKCPKGLEHLIEVFKTEVSDRAKKIDLSNNEDWYSLTLGWAVAKGVPMKQLHAFACYIRYNTDMA